MTQQVRNSKLTFLCSLSLSDKLELHFTKQAVSDHFAKLLRSMIGNNEPIITNYRLGNDEPISTVIIGNNEAVIMSNNEVITEVIIAYYY